MGLETIVVLSIAALAGGAGAFASAQQAKAENKASKRAAEAQNVAISVEQQQLRDQEALEKMQIQNKAHLIHSRIRVAAGESGLALGGTYQALQRQVDYDEQINQNIIAQNAMNRLNYAASKALPTTETNPLIAGLIGGLQGAQSGLSLGTSIGKLGAK